MEYISRKSVLSPLISDCLKHYKSGDFEAFVIAVHKAILLKKIRFPLLEHAADSFYAEIKAEDRLPFCDAIQSFQTIGGNVLLGVVLRSNLERDISQSLDKAAEYSKMSEKWYASDIIGERVFGHALRFYYESSIAEVSEKLSHENCWVARAAGAGIHNAVKKGIDRDKIEPLFQLLLANSNVKNYEAKRGVGWAVKTTAKFHPWVIDKYHKQIYAEGVGRWFKTKVKIGLERSKFQNRP